MKSAAKNSTERQTPAAALAAALVVLATVVAGCSQNNGSGSSSPYTYAANGCIGCGAGTSSVGSAIGRIQALGTEVMELQLQFYTALGSYSPAGSGYISQVAYTGPVGASGVLIVLPTISAVPAIAACPMVPGTYAIGTTRAGQLSLNSVYGLIMQGPGVAVSIANGDIAPAMPVAQSVNGSVFANLIQGRVQVMPATGCSMIDLSGVMENYFEALSF